MLSFSKEYVFFCALLMWMGIIATTSPMDVQIQHILVMKYMNVSTCTGVYSYLYHVISHTFRKYTLPLRAIVTENSPTYV